MKQVVFAFFILIVFSCNQESPKAPKPIEFPPEPQVAAPPVLNTKWENEIYLLGISESGFLTAWDKVQAKELWNAAEPALAQEPWVLTEDPEHFYTLALDGLFRKRRLDTGTLVWEMPLPQSFTPWTVQWSGTMTSFLGPEGQSAQVDNATGRLVSHREAPLPLRKNYWWSRGIRFPMGLDSSISGAPPGKTLPAVVFPEPIALLIKDGSLEPGDVMILPETGGPWFLDLKKAPRYLVWTPSKASVRTLRVEGNEGLPVKLSTWDWKNKSPLLSTGGYGDLDSGLRLNVKAKELTVIMVQAQSDEAPVTRAQIWWR